MKIALITGITKYDGAYLADLLLKKGYDTTKPDGTPRKLMYVSKLNDLGWS
jgi:GDP-D-mannose dehydratase